MRRPDGVEWVCEAYAGSDVDDCFMAAVAECADADECSQRMRAERQRVFRRLQELGARGGEYADLVDEFASPDELLNPGRKGPF